LIRPNILNFKWFRGYQSSDILQANGVIWTKGPSDRIYLLRWLNLFNPSLTEGLNFIIMFYWGRLLFNLTFKNKEVVLDLIPLLKLNRNDFVVMDRDCFSNNTGLNNTKKRIKAEVGVKKYWITKGR